MRHSEPTTAASVSRYDPEGSSRMHIEPATPALGAELRGVDLARHLDDAGVAALRACLLEHQLLFVRGQRFTPATLAAFTRRLGEPLRVPYVAHLPEEPDVIAVVKEADEHDVSVFGGDWHSDFTSLAEPPALTLLYAHEVPACGGDTVWSSQYRACETLSAGMRRMLEPLRAMHAGRPYGTRPGVEPARRLRGVQISRGHPEADLERAHPVVRRHPLSGRDALFVNPIYTTRFEDMSVEESRPLLEMLYRHAIRPEFCCRVHWTPGMLAIWDNRCTLHYAVNDYDGYRREMYRTTVAGETPV